MMRLSASVLAGRLLLGLALLALLTPGLAEARPKKAKGKAKATVALPGPIPPLPATTVTFTYEVTEAEADLFSSVGPAVQADADARPPTIEGAWTLGDWRHQLLSDIQEIESVRDQLAAKYDEMQLQSFPVAVRYLKGIHDAVAELTRLSWNAREDFAKAVAEEQMSEFSPEAPSEARRVRLYLDRARGLEGAAKSFLARAVEGSSQRVERIASED